MWGRIGGGTAAGAKASAGLPPERTLTCALTSRGFNSRFASRWASASKNSANSVPLPLPNAADPGPPFSFV